MKNKVGRLNGVTNLIMGIVTLLMGILLIINPEFKLTGLCSVVGAVLLVTGVVLLILYFGKGEYKNLQSSDFAVTVCMILGGILVMVRKEDISDIFPQFLSICLIISGVLKMQQAMDLFGMQQSSWLGHFIVGLLITVCSGLVVIMPQADWFTARDRVPLYICVLLIVDGGAGIGCLLHATAVKNRYRKLHPEETGKIEEKSC